MYNRKPFIEVDRFPIFRLELLLLAVAVGWGRRHWTTIRHAIRRRWGRWLGSESRLTVPLHALHVAGLTVSKSRWRTHSWLLGEPGLTRDRLPFSPHHCRNSEGVHQVHLAIPGRPLLNGCSPFVQIHCPIRRPCEGQSLRRIVFQSYLRTV